MRLNIVLPVTMGAVMGLMMLWMAHGALTGESRMAVPALMVFALAHLAVIGGIAVFAIWAVRFAPSFKERLDRMHRPSLRHMALMVGSAAMTALIVHVALHGGL